MDYQSYLIEENADFAFVELVNNHKVALREHYKKIIEMVKEFGAGSASLYNHHKITGFTFDVVPKGWKQVDKICTPVSKAIKKKFEDLNNQSPHPYPIFEYLQWQSFLIDGTEYDPEIRFIGETAVLLHPVFAEGEMNSLVLFKTPGLKEVTSNELLRIRQKHRGL